VGTPRSFKTGDIYDPRLNPLYRDVLAHYGVTALPCKVRDPDRKGKVESGVAHAQKTPLKGKRFESLEEAQAYLDDWEEHWADTRIHGRTKRQVAAMFSEEKPSLQADACGNVDETGVEGEGSVAVVTVKDVLPAASQAHPHPDTCKLHQHSLCIASLQATKPLTSSAYLLLGKTYYTLQQYERAAEMLAQVRGDNNSNSEASYWLERTAYSRLGGCTKPACRL